jgi:hypothetical protein
MCPRQGTDEIIDMDIPDDALEPLLDAGPNFVSALLQGQGEPLLYPNIFRLIPRIKAGMAAGDEVAPPCGHAAAIKKAPGKSVFLWKGRWS